MNSNLNPHILRYMEAVENEEIKSCVEQHLLIAYVRRCFANENIHTDDEQLNKYLGLAKYFPYEKLFEWEEFVFALHCCTYREDGMPRWPDLFVLVGRGAGKDGYIAFETFCLSSEHNGIKKYNVDVCANNEDQAMRPLQDIIDALEQPKWIKRLRRFFYWNKEEVVNLKTGSIIKGRTNSPKGKDGLRPGIVYFNETHQYLDYKNINVFTTALGKVKHPRRGYMTTNGDVRGGPLDDMIANSLDILKGDIPDNGMLPFICRLDSREEVDDPSCWVKANPSLRYLPELMEEITKEYADWKKNPIQFTAFLTKRMNFPDGSKDVEVTAWENILATNKPLPDLIGRSGVVGIDYSKVTDFASAVVHFRIGETRYDIAHSWLCLKSKDLHRLKIPYREWAELGMITLVDDVEINPDLIANWVADQALKYNIQTLVLDNFRYALLANSLAKVGFSVTDYKNVKLVRPSDIMKVVPIIDRCFANQWFIWGDNPLLRWATNNTKLVRSSRNIGSDTGNLFYAKIEGQSRKTDPFMALAHAMCIEDELGTGEFVVCDMPVYSY